jgi:uncharacterized protein (TIGR00251 family)
MAARSRAGSSGAAHSGTTPASASPSTCADAAIVDSPGGCLVAVRVIPRAKRSAFDGQRDGASPDAKVWLVRLAAPPVDGAANDALIALFAEVFDLPRRSIQIVSGERAREKRVRLEGLSAAAASARLAQLPA